jgi:hypothetical protein
VAAVTARPWRAVAWVGGGPLPRIRVGRTSAATRAGLDRFVERWTEVGAAVDLWEVLPIPGVTDALQPSDSSAG